jgi:hypothetical protein
MDINFAVIGGRLVAPPDHQTFDTGSRRSRFLVTVKSDHPQRRIDVIPITFWNPPHDLCDTHLEVGTDVVAVGSIHRRFSDGPEGRRSMLEMQSCAVLLRRGEGATFLAEG